MANRSQDWRIPGFIALTLAVASLYQLFQHNALSYGSFGRDQNEQFVEFMHGGAPLTRPAPEKKP